MSGQNAYLTSRQGDAEDPIGDDELVVGTGMPGRLEREMVAIHHFHRQTDPRHVLAKFIRCWTPAPGRTRGRPRRRRPPG